jgi:hypothetical protein
MAWAVLGLLDAAASVNEKKFNHSRLTVLCLENGSFYISVIMNIYRPKRYE